MAERGLTKTQIRRLLSAIDPNHVDKKQGRMSYMAHHEVRAELTRIFGYGNWDAQTEKMEFLWESVHAAGTNDPDYPKERDGTEKPGGKPYYRACYMATVRVNIRDYWGNPVASFVGAHSEANSVLPDRGEAHAMAVTSVESYALRRAVISLGDRFGLSLYDKGSEMQLVKGTLQFTDEESPLFVSDEEKAALAAKRAERMQAAVNNNEGQTGAAQG